MPLDEAKGLMSGIESACPAAYSATSQPTPSRPSSSAFQRFRNLDFLGDDLSADGFRDVTLSQCESICTNFQQCVAYSYVQRLKWCFLKGGLGNSVTKSGITSGIRQ